MYTILCIELSYTACVLYKLSFTGFKKKQARNRWAVAYTLVHNPSLRPLRAAQLKEQESNEEPQNDNHYEVAQTMLLPLIN